MKNIQIFDLSNGDTKTVETNEYGRVIREIIRNKSGDIIYSYVDATGRDGPVSKLSFDPSHTNVTGTDDTIQ